jgi:hypothetical protein
MVIQMTRAEYEATYGVKPTFSKVESFDTTPAPTLMTRAEYNAKYRPESLQPTLEEARKTDWRYKVGDFIVNKTPIGIPFKMAEAAKSGAERFKTGVDQTVEGTQGNKPTLLGRGILNEIGGGLGIAFYPITGLVSWGAGLPGVKQTVSAVDKYLIQPTADRISDSPYMQSLAMAVPQDVAENTLILGMALFGGAKQKPIENVIKTGIREGEYTIIGGGPKNKTGLIPQAQTAIENFQQGRKTTQINELAGTLNAVENGYSSLKKAKTFEKNADASLQRIAQAHIDSGLLKDVVDSTGTINTSNAIKRYAAETVDGSEGVVRQNLALEKKTVNLGEVERELISKIDPAFEGAALTNAINGVKKEIAGLKTRADEFGNILLEKIQDAKVQTNSGIDYKKETTNVIKYKKLVANTYKTIIENKSEFKVTINGKQYGVKQINEALSKFYQDMDRLRALDGKKVNGGKLSKYFAQISGNLIGGAAGSVVGGPLGMAIGTVVGGETAGYLKGKGMTGTFGQGGQGIMERNPLLQEAKVAGKKPSEVNLKVADPVVSTPSSIVKTKEIILIERQIKKNVESQKKAIKAGDFSLVATLKTIYQALVGKLKDLIKQIKETPNKKGGFVKNPLQSYNRGNLKTQYKNSNITTKTSIDNTLSQKGKEIKAQGEQKPTIKLKRDVTATLLSGEKVNIPEDEVLKAYESGGKILLKDGREYIVSKNQYENIKNNSKTNEVKEFAPELKQTEENIKNDNNYPSREELPKELQTMADRVDAGTMETYDFAEKAKKLGYTVEYDMDGTVSGIYKSKGEGLSPTKYSSYTLPDGKNYKEILIKAPTAKDANIHYNLEDYENFPKEVTKLFEKAGDDNEAIIKGLQKLGYEVDYSPGSFDLQGFWKSTSEAPIFKSSHWDEPNVISHLRMNERTYNGKKVTFMEELQSDWAREARKNGFLNPLTDAEKAEMKDYATRTQLHDRGQGPTLTQDEAMRWAELTDRNQSLGKTPNHPLLKNWQTLAVKRALKEAVDSGADYFAWINGDQTSARYNLATHLENATWKTNGQGNRSITLKPKSGEDIFVITNKDGIITAGKDWHGKKLDEVLGKGLADKIMADESGTLSGEGLKFGGEWANTLYDKQVKNIVEDLTGQKVEVLDMGLNNATKELEMYKRDLKLLETEKDVVNREEKINELKKKIASIPVKKSAGQQGIKITPEIKAMVKGEKPKL